MRANLFASALPGLHHMILAPRFSHALAVIVFCLVSHVAAGAAPAHLIVCAPSSAGSGELSRKLAAWRQSGSIAAGQVLAIVPGARSAETVPPNTALGAVAVVEFADEMALGRWQKSPDAKLPAGFTATRVDLLSRLEVVPRDSRVATFLIAEYEIMVPPAATRITSTTTSCPS